jgi:hypothetical protein
VSEQRNFFRLWLVLRADKSDTVIVITIYVLVSIGLILVVFANRQGGHGCCIRWLAQRSSAAVVQVIFYKVDDRNGYRLHDYIANLLFCRTRHRTIFDSRTPTSNYAARRKQRRPKQSDETSAPGRDGAGFTTGGQP